MKKILSVLLALVMIVGMLPMSILTASAAEGTWTLVTDASQLVAGDQVIIAAKDSLLAMSTTQNGNNRGQTAIVKNDNTLQTPSASVQVLTLQAGNVANTFAFYTGSGYLYAASSSSNHLKTETKLSNNSSWSISIATNGTATIKAQGTSTRNVMQYNQSSSLFACYSSASQKPICLYKLQASASSCDHSDYAMQNVVAASCTTDGFSGDKYCNSCQKVVESGKVLEKTGHNFVDGACQNCQINLDDLDVYKLASIDDITAGTYVIGSPKNGAYPAVNLNTGACNSNGDWTVSGSAVTAIDDTITSDLFPEGIQTLVFAGNNTDGFTISYNNGETDVYLGYSDITVNRKLGFKADYSNILWTVKYDATKKVTYLLSAGTYAVSYNAGDLRGYNAPDKFYTTIYLFKQTCAHVYTSVVTAPTCDVDGYTTYTCSKCGDQYTSDVTTATGHNYVEGSCSVCGEADPDVCKHTETTTTPVEATCVQAGSITVTCNACGEVISSEEIPATGEHDFVDYVCSVCGELTVPAADSTLTLPEASALGLTKEHNTYTADKYYVTGVVEEIANSTYGNINIKDEAGNKFYIYGVYSADGETRYDAMETKLVVGDTVTLYGVIGRYNETAQMKNGWLVKHLATGCRHENATTTTVEATCTTAGSTTLTCGDCGHVEVTEIPALGHNYVDGVCSVCGTAQPELPDVTNYELVTVENVTAGNYVIGAIRSGAYPAVYLATGASNGDIVVDGTAVTAENDQLTEEQVTKAKVFVLTGDNTNGFTIGYNDGTKMVYLGYTEKANRKLAFSDAYSNVLWKIQVHNDGVKLTDGNINIFQNSTGTSAIRGYTSNYSDAKGIYLFRQIDAGSSDGPACTHEYGAWTEVTPATCTTEGKEQAVCALCEDVKFQTIPAIGHAYTFAETTVTCGNCGVVVNKSNIGDLPKAASSTLYYIEGTVTYVSGRNVYMEDATGGICVYYAYNEQKDVVVGDVLRVCDSLITYNDLIETDNTLYVETQKVSSGNALPNKTITVAELLADASGDKNYLSTRITLNQVTLGEINTSGNTTITDAEGNATAIRYMPAIDGIAAGSVVNVTAVVSIYKGTYQLYVNAEDVVLAPVAPTVEITHISLDPANDALGYKAAATNAPEGSSIEISLWVDESIVVTKTVGENKALRLKNILANNGGEMTIYAKATLKDAEGNVIAESKVEQTSMKEVISIVNDMTDLGVDKEAAVYELYTKYDAIIDAWLGDNNQIATWG